MSEQQSDPRARPPDPAGTQPKVDPESLRTQAGDAQLTLPDGARPALTAGRSPSPDAQRAAGAGGVTLDATTFDSAALDVSSTSVAQPGAHAAPARGAPTSSANSNAPRFQFLFGALGALSVAVVALAIALLRAPAPTPERPWSGWKPATNGVDPAQQIATYVAPQYRLDDGKQIVQVSGGPPTLKGQPLTVGVVHSGQTPAALEGNNVLYQLCGDGVNCSIKEGKPSTQRALLLAREALELALYTFRYVSGVDQVLVTIPPPPPGSTKTSDNPSTKTVTGEVPITATGSSSSDTSTSVSSSSPHIVNHALLFSQQDLAPALSQPLSTTLSTVTPLVSQMDRWPDAATVKALTEPRLYDFTISETQEAGAVMLLEPPGLGG